MAHLPNTLRRLTLAAGLALGLGGGLAATTPAEAMPVPAVNPALSAPAATEQPLLQDVQYYRPYHRHWHRPHWRRPHWHRHYGRRW